MPKFHDASVKDNWMFHCWTHEETSFFDNVRFTADKNAKTMLVSMREGKFSDPEINNKVMHEMDLPAIRALQRFLNDQFGKAD